MNGISSKAFGGTENHLKFNGKEEQRKEFADGSGLEWLDYGARMYDNQTMRWMTIDPLADQFENWSPYVYTYDEPIKHSDPDGRSGIVTIDKNTKTVTVSSTITMYGNGASASLAKEAASSIQNQWNSANGKTTIDGVEYSVKFSVTGDYVDATGGNEKVVKNFVENNKDFSQNFIKVDKDGTGSVSDGQPNNEPGGNTGVWALKDIQGSNTTTESHEYGHTLGAVTGGTKGHPKNEESLIGKGQPGIMNPKGTLVDAKYTRNSKGGNGVLDPDKRKVTQKDINYLNLDKLNFDKNGKANIGNITHIFHQ